MIVPYLGASIWQVATENTSLEGSSLAESLRAAAEAAVSQTGFSYDENTDCILITVLDSIMIPYVSDLFILDGCVPSCLNAYY